MGNQPLVEKIIGYCYVVQNNKFFAVDLYEGNYYKLWEGGSINHMHAAENDYLKAFEQYQECVKEGKKIKTAYEINEGAGINGVPEVSADPKAAEKEYYIRTHPHVVPESKPEKKGLFRKGGKKKKENNIKCVHCGTVNKKDQKFCGECGKKLFSEDEEVFLPEGAAGVTRLGEAVSQTGLLEPVAVAKETETLQALSEETEVAEAVPVDYSVGAVTERDNPEETGAEEDASCKEKKKKKDKKNKKKKDKKSDKKNEGAVNDENDDAGNEPELSILPLIPQQEGVADEETDDVNNDEETVGENKGTLVRTVEGTEEEDAAVITEESKNGEKKKKKRKFLKGLLFLIFIGGLSASVIMLYQEGILDGLIPQLTGNRQTVSENTDKQVSENQQGEVFDVIKLKNELKEGQVLSEEDIDVTTISKDQYEMYNSLSSGEGEDKETLILWENRGQVIGTKAVYDIARGNILYDTWFSQNKTAEDVIAVPEGDEEVTGEEEEAASGEADNEDIFETVNSEAAEEEDKTEASEDKEAEVNQGLFLGEDENLQIRVFYRNTDGEEMHAVLSEESLKEYILLNFLGASEGEILAFFEGLATE